jgi:chromosomal replication initiation ATPase DnaA
MKNEIFNDYVERIVGLYKIPKEEIFSKIKRTDVVDARQMLFYLCNRRNISHTQIKRYLIDEGLEMTISTILHGIKVMEEKISNDSDYKQIINKIK